MTIVQLFLLELCVRFYPWTVQIPAPVTHSIPASRLFNGFRNQQNQHQQSNHGINGALFSSVGGGSGSGSGSGSTPLSTSPPLSSTSPLDHVTTRASRVHGSGVGWYREHAMYWGTHFWNWPTIGPYYLFLAVFTLVLGLSLAVIGNTPFYVGLLGLAVSEREEDNWVEIYIITKKLTTPFYLAKTSGPRNRGHGPVTPGDPELPD